MNDTIIGILIGACIALVTTWFNQKGETQRLKKRLKYECVKEEINELRIAFDKFKKQIWQSYKKKLFPIELVSEVFALYPDEIRKDVIALFDEFENIGEDEFHEKITLIFEEMNKYIFERRKKLIEEI